MTSISPTPASQRPRSNGKYAAEPVVVQLSERITSEAVFQSLSRAPHAVFFDSAQHDAELGRYSYVAADPCQWVIVEPDGRPALGQIQQMLEPWGAQRIEGLPPWQGGAAGMIGYEVGRSLERLPSPRWNEFRIPALAIGLYDFVVAFDHESGQAWAISQGIPETDPDRRQRRAESRMEWLLGLIEGREPVASERSQTVVFPRRELAPSHEAPGHEGVLSDFSREGYLEAVSETIAMLQAGEAYQVNLSQRLITPVRDDPAELYLRLRKQNPAPFASYLDGGAWRVASASPERFLSLDRGVVETRPIKGTRPRGIDPEQDACFAQELLQSEKDRAENVMIVDLLRNDLARVCDDASITVPELFRLEKYERVQHLVSVVRGHLRGDCDVADLLAATLPGGSITGAPKVRAQEIIAALEPTARGAYCGAMAWFGLADETGASAMDSSVLIRTITSARGWLQLPVGGGVVVQSDPEQEYDETWHKARGMIEAIHP